MNYYDYSGYLLANVRYQVPDYILSFPAFPEEKSIKDVRGTRTIEKIRLGQTLSYLITLGETEDQRVDEYDPFEHSNKASREFSPFYGKTKCANERPTGTHE